VASMTNSGEINLYNMPEIGQIKDGQRVDNGHELQRLKGKLTGLTDESFALSWNKEKKGLLTSAAQTTICVWDTQKGSEPSLVFDNAHTDSINDVKFGPDGNLLISTADDGHFKIWDLRSAKKFTMAYKAAEDDSLCVGQFNPLNHNIFAVAGSSSGEIQIWDMRMPASEINSFSYHSSQVTLLEWCPTQENILASGSDDKHIYIWD
jgi:WD40 repeat protein